MTPERDTELADAIFVETLKPPRGTFGKTKLARIHTAFPDFTLAEIKAAVAGVRAGLQARADMMVAKRAAAEATKR